MAKVLMITWSFPRFPGGNGIETRQFCLLKHLSKKHDISIVTFEHKKNELQLAKLKEFCKTVEAVPLAPFKTHKTAPKWSSKLAVYLRETFFERVDWMVNSDRLYKAIQNSIERIIDEEEFDIIQIEGTPISPWIVKIKGNASKLLVLPDVLSRWRYTHLKSERNLRRKVVLFPEWLKTVFYERAMISKFDECVVVSELEKKSLLSILPNANVTVVPNGVDAEYFDPQSCEPYCECTTPNLVFTGAMSYRPNVSGIVAFCKEVLPLIKCEIPEVKLYIVGRNPAKEVEALGQDENVIVTGFVDDVRPFVVSAAVFVVYLSFGGGTRLKVLEALSMGKAVVSTSFGAEGINVSHGDNIMLCDKPEEFAKVVVNLLKNKNIREKLENRGRVLIEREYDWSVIASRLDGLYEKMRLPYT